MLDSGPRDWFAKSILAGVRVPYIYESKITRVFGDVPIFAALYSPTTAPKQSEWQHGIGVSFFRLMMLLPSDPLSVRVEHFTRLGRV